MLNQVVLVGRLTQDPSLESNSTQKTKMVVNVAVSRPFKNSDGIYETDFIRCILWNGIASNTAKYCHKGDIVGLKGRLQTTVFEDSNQDRKYITEVIVERISYISTLRKSEEQLVEIEAE